MSSRLNFELIKLQLTELRSHIDDLLEHSLEDFGLSRDDAQSHFPPHTDAEYWLLNDYSEQCYLNVHLKHLYQHLNLAWNLRYATDFSYGSISREEFAALMDSFPVESDFERIPSEEIEHLLDEPDEDCHQERDAGNQF